MSDKHNYSFFGQNTGIIINSSSKKEPYFFIRCLKKKQDGSWEKPSVNEGKVIKCSLDEIVMILEVLNHRQLNWASYHTYKSNKTHISFGWEDEQAKTLWINIAGYSKMLNFAQTEIFRLLLTHILKEKIKYATAGSAPQSLKVKEPKEVENSYPPENKNFGTVQEEVIIDNNPLKKEITPISGAIKGETEKALLIAVDSGQEIWIPKSTIHNQYVPQKLFNQNFKIDNWILKRNQILA